MSPDDLVSFVFSGLLWEGWGVAGRQQAPSGDYCDVCVGHTGEQHFIQWSHLDFKYSQGLCCEASSTYPGCSFLNFLRVTESQKINKNSFKTFYCQLRPCAFKDFVRDPFPNSCEIPPQATWRFCLRLLGLAGCCWVLIWNITLQQVFMGCIDKSKTRQKFRAVSVY